MTQPMPIAGAQDRAPRVRAMFDRLAPRYDLANRVLSLGLDQAWRRRAIAALGTAGKGEVLDLCAGTLDFTASLLEEGASRVYAVDFSQPMLDAGAHKLAADAPVELICADARRLPLADDSVDAIVSGFGLRNVPEVEVAVAECSRVLRPGGRLVVLDFFRPETLIARILQGSWNRLVVPLIGGWITGVGEAYRYLFQSIDSNVSRADFEAVLVAAGFIATGRDLLPPVASLVMGVRAEVSNG